MLFRKGGTLLFGKIPESLKIKFGPNGNNGPWTYSAVVVKLIEKRYFTGSK